MSSDVISDYADPYTLWNKGTKLLFNFSFGDASVREGACDQGSINLNDF